MNNKESDLVKSNDKNIITDESSDLAIQGISITRELEFYEGVIPHPDIFKKLGEVDPSFPERIMKMTEDNNRHEIKQERLGQILSFVLGISCLGLSAFLALRGLSAGALAAALGGISPIILAIIESFRKK